MSDLVGFLAVVLVGGGLIWLALRIEPHWVSRDGQRFICRGQLIDDRGNTQSGWNEYRFRITPEGEVAANRRGLLAGRRAIPGVWRVAARSDSAPRRKAVFLLHPVRDAGSMMAIRLPANSRARETLDALATG